MTYGSESECATHYTMAPHKYICRLVMIWNFRESEWGACSVQVVVLQPAEVHHSFVHQNLLSGEIFIETSANLHVLNSTLATYQESKLVALKPWGSLTYLFLQISKSVAENKKSNRPKHAKELASAVANLYRNSLAGHNPPYTSKSTIPVLDSRSWNNYLPMSQANLSSPFTLRGSVSSMASYPTVHQGREVVRLSGLIVRLLIRKIYRAKQFMNDTVDVGKFLNKRITHNADAIVWNYSWRSLIKWLRYKIYRT